jgi:pimeloyl-ACP methyl ester carboxylesterase
MSAVVRAAAFLLLPVVAANVSAQPTTPTPSKAHASRSGFVTVNGVRLNYLDWGGTGDTILFLAGFNAFYSVTANTHYPSHWLPENADASIRAKAEAWWQTKGHALMRVSVEQFRREIPCGEIIELEDAQHYVFTGDTARDVALKTREFLLR